MLDKNSGLTISNYKEPLKKVAAGAGYGYMGCLMSTVEGDKVQCHVCGKLFSGLSMHVYQTHGMKAKDYKRQFGLSMKTALVSEDARQALKMRTLAWLNNMTPSQKKAHWKKRLTAVKKWQKENPNKLKNKFKFILEYHNKRASCPDQIIHKLKTVAEKIGHTPTKNEFIDECKGQRYVHLIYSTFGSYKKACELAGLKPHAAFDIKNVTKPRYNSDELLDYLTIFWRESGRVPTETDFKRGLLPSSQIYKRRFGSIPNARKMAGITEQPKGRWGINK